MSGSRRECPHCRSVLQPIRVIDKTHHRVHAELEYAAAEAQRSFWTGGYPVEGRLAAFLCDRCGGVQFYAESKRDVR